MAHDPAFGAAVVSRSPSMVATSPYTAASGSASFLSTTSSSEIPRLDPDLVPTPPVLGSHGGRFHCRSLRCVAYVLSNDAARRSAGSKLLGLAGAGELPQQSPFGNAAAAAPAAPLMAVRKAGRVWKERVLGLQASFNKGLAFTIQKAHMGNTTVKVKGSAADLGAGAIVEPTDFDGDDAPGLGDASLASAPSFGDALALSPTARSGTFAADTPHFRLPCQGAADTKEGTTFTMATPVVGSVPFGAHALDFACRREEATRMAFGALSAAAAADRELRTGFAALRQDELCGKPLSVRAMVRMSDLVPMRPTSRAADSLPRRRSAAVLRHPPLEFEGQLSVTADAEAPEFKLKGHAFAATTPGSKPTKLQCKLVILLDKCNLDPPVTASGDGVVLWVEADKEQMLPAIVRPVANAARLGTVPELRTAIVAVVRAITHMQRLVDALPQMTPERSASPALSGCGTPRTGQNTPRTGTPRTGTSRPGTPRPGASGPSTPREVEDAGLRSVRSAAGFLPEPTQEAAPAPVAATSPFSASSPAAAPSQDGSSDAPASPASPSRRARLNSVSFDASVSDARPDAPPVVPPIALRRRQPEPEALAEPQPQQPPPMTVPPARQEPSPAELQVTRDAAEAAAAAAKAAHTAASAVAAAVQAQTAAVLSLHATQEYCREQLLDHEAQARAAVRDAIRLSAAVAAAERAAHRDVRDVSVAQTRDPTPVPSARASAGPSRVATPPPEADADGRADDDKAGEDRAGAPAAAVRPSPVAQPYLGRDDVFYTDVVRYVLRARINHATLA